MELPQGIKMTPMLEQYLHWKERYPDCLLFFRMGDFYEMFFDDAKTASSVLDIALTSRSRESDNAIPMAGVPFHSVDSYLGRLISAGYKVAVCDQVTEPDGKTLVRREVTRIVTPGTWLPENSESDGHLVSCVFESKNISLALLCSASGSLKAGTLPVADALSILSSFKPDEILVSKGQAGQIISLGWDVPQSNIVERERGEFSVRTAAAWFCRKWGIASLSSMGIDDTDPALGAAYAALRYLEETQFSQAKHVTCITPLLPSANLALDQNTQTNLELTESNAASLFSVLNKCRTPMGKRLLKDWILSPLQDLIAIEERQSSIGLLVEDRRLASSFASLLERCRDIAKAIGRMTLRMGTPQDLLAIKETLAVLPELKHLALSYPCLKAWAADVPDLSTFSELLERAIADDAPRFVRDGGVIKKGYCAKLDEWREKASDSASWLEMFAESQRAETGIKTLKAGFNKVFGYYLEIPNGSLDKVPPAYIRKQTLVGAERFITDELKAFEKEMLSAEGEILRLEAEIYENIVYEALANSTAIQTAARFVSSADVLCSLAQIAYERKYTRPAMDMSTDFIVKGARHPVIEVTLGQQPFTPNDYNLGSAAGQRIAIITGPNMAGKSTYLRTAALIAIMAHIGSFVPAESARIGVIDRVFTRIGARDELARGQSTFMVEMAETANILRHATDRSLVVLDEVGRGTSTYDGLSIAWSVVEYLHGQEGRQAKVLFATHYHELTKLADMLPGVVNLSMAVEESSKGVTFLHKVVQSPSDRSYGIEVARLAGVPHAVLRRSEELLEQFEGSDTARKASSAQWPQQSVLFDIKQQAVLEELAAAEPDEMTPMEALQLVYRLREESRKALGAQ